MRLDKYLKVSRIIKRRTVAKEAGEGGRVSINGKVAKPSSEVKEGDDFIELESMLVEEHTAAFAAAALHGLGKVARQGGVLVHVPCRRNHGDADTLSIRHDEMTERHNH